MTTWDSTVDFVIVGSGGGGMVAALTASHAGASALVLEKQALIGGSTAMSGGVVWVPDNPVMRADGVADSYEDAMAHFDAVVGDVGPASSRERREAFLTAGPEMVSFLQRCGVRFVYCPGYSDYYSNAKGGHDLGRSIEPIPFDGRVLGDWLERLQPGLAKSLGLAVMTNEARSLSNYNRSMGALATSARVFLRTCAARVRRQELLTNGASLIGQMLNIALAREIPIWTDTPLDDVIVEDGRVVGVRAIRAGAPVSIRARKGVLLSAGGLRTQRRDAQRVRRGAAESSEVVDRQSWRHRGGPHGCHAPRGEDRPDGRSLVAALTPDREVRAIDARPGPPAPAHDLRRRRGKALRERVELVHGGGQGDVRARPDQSGSPVLACLR